MSTSLPRPPRVLFVDDEPSILAGLKRMLHPLRHDIQSEFAGSGAQALARLAVESFDIVVTDLRMPVMDGPALLAELQRLHPHIIRLALSGHADLDTTMRAVPVAHQFLAKPCDAKTLREVILRVAGLRCLLEERELQTLAAGLRDIPARPESYTALSNQLADPNGKSSDLAALISRDVGLTANLLRIVNSAFFGLPRRVTSIQSAITYLGTATLRSFALANAVTTVLGPRAREYGYDLELNEAHSLLSANLAMQLFTDKQAREDAFMAALLQNIGELLLVAAAPPYALTAFSHAKATGMPLDAAERELKVVSHAQVGAYLLGAWGLPFGLVEAIAHHHQPHTIAHDTLEPVDAVYAAGLIADHFLLRRPDALELARARLQVFGAASLLPKLEASAKQCLMQAEQTP
jgi:HD-like signal output (HDOD) protein/ActR/RegA family two-component response regulator